MADLATQLEASYSGAVFDVLRERGFKHCVLPKEIAPLDLDRVMAGPAFTVRGSDKAGLSADDSILAWTELLSRAPRGCVVVIASGGAERALMGELSAETLQFRGVRGVVTDGGCRDCAFIRRIGFPVFSRYRTPRDVVARWTPDAFEETLRFADVAIAPGDYVVGDIDGIVCIPSAIVAAVTEEVQRVMTTESLVRKAILDGVDPKEAYLSYGRF